jgi:putative transposase
METIHTDNAKEFISDVLVLNCKDYGISVKHRDIPRKHQGGHIESLIGKMMTRKIHFLPGTTGSNVLQRKALQSEKKASITFEKLRQIITYQISVYHETKHSALSLSPREAWDGYYKKSNTSPKHVAASEEENFRYRFFPEKTKQIVPEGIEMFRRFYYSPALRTMIRARVLVKYDPYDISFILVETTGGWLKVPCSRNQFERSNVFEMYRYQRNQKSSANGTMSAEGGQSFRVAKQIVEKEIKDTVQARRAKKKAKGVAHHKQHVAQLTNDDLENAGSPKDRVSPSSGSRKRIGSTQASKGKKSNVVDFTTALTTHHEDFGDPVIYAPVERW